eukprot:6213617-Pleurochrysis_carterae.AAC.1
MSQTCQYRHSPNQSLVAHTGSASGSDHSLDAPAPVVWKVSSNVHDHVGRIKGPGRHSAPRARKDSEREKRVYTQSIVAKAKQGGTVLLESDVAKWLTEDVRRVVLALDVLRWA